MNYNFCELLSKTIDQLLNTHYANEQWTVFYETQTVQDKDEMREAFNDEILDLAHIFHYWSRSLYRVPSDLKGFCKLSERGERVI